MEEEMAFVSVEFEYEYKAKDGRHISIKPNERYILVSKTNDIWWRVCKDQDSKPFYVPAEYVREASVPPGDSTGPKNRESSKGQNKIKPTDGKKSKAVNMTKKTSVDTKTVNHLLFRDDSKETYRFSTFGLCVNMPSEALSDAPAARNRAHSWNDIKKPMTHNSSDRVSVTPEPKLSEDKTLFDAPCPDEKQLQAKNPKQDKSTEKSHVSVDDKDAGLPPPNTYDMDFPLPPPPFCAITPEISVTECDSFPEPPDFTASSPEESPSQHQSSDLTAEKASITEEKVMFLNNMTLLFISIKLAG